jgi:lipopolysaccharide/colanic/teichoic acid biosynthesis glycosyltransferase
LGPSRFRRLADFFLGVDQSPSLAGVQDAETLLNILERERARSDRTGNAFSCVVFRADGGAGKSDASMRRLAQILVNTVRIGDAIGWIAGGNLAAVLPSVSAEGAGRFADRVAQKFGQDGSELLRTIHTYPHRKDSSTPRPESSPPPGGPDGDTSSEPPEKRNAPPKQDRAGPAGSMEPLFSRRTPVWKRALDVTGAMLGLILFSPLFLLQAILIKTVSPGPVLFRQERIGYGGKPFTFLKFRTMHVSSDSTVHRKHLHDLIDNDKILTKLDAFRDPRIIPFGNVLRQSCLDELPQLINVLSGEMSLVGPRPIPPYEADEYLPWQRQRFDVLPGLTGLWQVSGKNRTTFREMMRLDVGYSKKVSLWQDAKIVLKTLPVIFTQVSGFLAGRRMQDRGLPAAGDQN